MDYISLPFLSVLHTPQQYCVYFKLQETFNTIFFQQNLNTSIAICS